MFPGKREHINKTSGKGMRKILLGVLVLLVSVSVCGGVKADELRVLDCDGTSRLVQDVGKSTSTVTFHLVDSSGVAIREAKVTLENGGTGVLRTATSDNGIISIDNLSPGAWTVCSTQGQLRLTDIVVQNGIQGAGISRTSLLGGLGVVGAGGAIATGVAASGGGAAAVLPIAALSVAPAPAPVSGSTSGGTTSTLPRPVNTGSVHTSDVDDCDFTQVVAVLSPSN